MKNRSHLCGPVVAAGLAVAALGATPAAADTCKPAGFYEGSYTADYTARSHAGDSYVFQIAFVNFLSGNTLSTVYLTSSGVYGTGSGVVDLSTCTAKMAFANVNACTGQYAGTYTYADGGVTWTYSGEDCWGTLNGEGKASQ